MPTGGQGRPPFPAGIVEEFLLPSERISCRGETCAVALFRRRDMRFVPAQGFKKIEFTLWTRHELAQIPELFVHLAEPLVHLLWRNPSADLVRSHVKKRPGDPAFFPVEESVLQCQRQPWWRSRQEVVHGSHVPRQMREAGARS